MANFLDKNGLTYLFGKLKALFLGKTETAYKTQAIYTAKVDSTSTATAYTATIDGITELRDGLAIMLTNGVVTSAANCTLNINGLGAKPIYQTMAAATAVTTTFNVNYTMLFVYNTTRASGGCWDMYYGYNSNDNTIAYHVRDYQADKKMKNALYRYMVVFTADDGTLVPSCNTSNSTSTSKTLSSTPFNPALPIYYYSATGTVAVDASPSASSLWVRYSACNLRYGFNVSSTQLTAKEPVFVQTVLQSDGQVVLSGKNCIVQALPSTEDGYLYIFLGYAYSQYQMELAEEHPAFWYKDGAIREYSYDAISEIKVNNTALTPSSGSVNITVPTQTSQLTNNSNFVVDASYVHTDNNYTTTEKNKLGGIASGAQVNVIETVKVNGTALTPTDKAVNIITSASDIAWDDVTDKPFDEESTPIFTYTCQLVEKYGTAGYEGTLSDGTAYNALEIGKKYRVTVNDTIGYLIVEDSSYDDYYAKTLSNNEARNSSTRWFVELGYNNGNYSIMIMSYAGLTVGQTITLTIEDVDVETGTTVWTGSGTTDSSSKFTVWLTGTSILSGLSASTWYKVSANGSWDLMTPQRTASQTGMYYKFYAPNLKWHLIVGFDDGSEREYVTLEDYSSANTEVSVELEEATMIAGKTKLAPNYINLTALKTALGLDGLEQALEDLL